MKKKSSTKGRPPKPAAKRNAKIPPQQDRLLSLEFLQGRADERENLLALERLLTRAEGFTLAFARVNMPAQRAALAQEISRRVEPKGSVIIEVDLATPVHDLLDELRQRLKSFYSLKTKDQKRELAVAEAGPRFAVFVYGLEHSISSSAIYHPLLAVMNYKRENFREQIPGPLVLWVPEYVLQAIIEGAPDFWAWRSGVFEFAAPPAELEKMRGQFESERGYFALARLPSEEKKNRIQLFSILLAEYEAHDDANTPEIAAIRGDLLNRLGLLHDHLGELSKALEYYERSLSIRRMIGDRAGEGRTLNNISQVFNARGDYGKALEYLEKSLAIQREIGDRAGLIPTLHNMAHIYQGRNRVKESLECFAEALQLSIETNRPYDVFDESRDLGVLLSRLGDKKQGRSLLQQALEVGKQIGHPGLPQVEELLRQYS